MSRSLIISFHSVSRKYFRLKKQVQKSISRGEFWRFTKRKRSYILHKIERLKRRLSELRTQIKFVAAGAAAAMVLAAGTASAQNTSTSPIGPFNPAPLKNPFPPPQFYRMDHPTLVYKDMDGDGDLDAIQSSDDYQLIYFQNNGTIHRPLFKQPDDDNTFQEVDLEGYIGDNRTSAAFADIDDDGDMDMVVGQTYTNITPDPDFIYFYRNDAGPNAKPHFTTDGENNPFGDISLEYEGWPVFVDIDNDGDQDLVVAGSYDDTQNAKQAWIQVFRNTKVGHAIDVDPVFEPLPPAENPLYMLDAEEGYMSIGFADLDKDGDMDFAYSPGSGGGIRYKRNDNGVFLEQTGTWQYNANNPGASTGNPFQNLILITPTDSKYRSLAFGDTDGDGDQDLTIGVRTVLNATGSSYVFVENTGNGSLVARNFDITNPVTGIDFGDNVGTSLADYDHDGDLDMIISSVSERITNECSDENTECVTVAEPGMMIVRNDGGVYTPLVFQPNPFQEIQPDFGGETPNGVNYLIVDVDGDEDLDVFLMLKDTYPHLKYFRNEGGEYTELPVEESPLNFLHDGFGTIDIDFADLDGDGLLDMVLGEYGEKLRAYKNTGSVGEPVFTQEPAWETGFKDFLSAYVHPKFIDLDNDGDMDLVVGKYRNLYYYENIGNATTPNFFEYRSNDPSLDPNRFKNPFLDINLNGGVPDAPTPTLVDVDGDGDKDLLFGNRYGLMTYYENQNPTPVVTQGRSELEFSPDDQVILDPQITLTDPDDDKIAKIIIKIEPFEQGMESLEFDDVYPDIEGNWNDDAGELTLTGNASIEDFEQALRSVMYRNSFPENFQRKAATDRKGNARTFTKNITFLALDSDGTTSTTSTAAYAIVHTNALTVVSPNVFNVTYNSAPIVLTSTVTVTDADDPLLASAEVRFTGGTYHPAEDRLTIPVDVAGIDSEFDAINGVIYLTGAAPASDYQEAIRRIAYNNILGASAATTARTLEIKVHDGESDSNIGVINLSIFAVNPPPVLAPASATASYTGANVALNPTVVVTDNDTTITSANIIFTNGFVTGEDKLLFTNQNGITGTFDDANGSLSLSGSTTLANYQVALRSVQYSNVATNRTAGARTVSFTVNDGAFSSNNSVVTVTIANTPPVVTGTSSNFWASGAVVVNNNIVIADVDNATLQGATVTISAGFNVAEDRLLFTNQNGITGTTAAGSPTLTLTGTSSVANYQTALRSIRYENASGAPSTTNREFTFAVTDGGTTTTLGGSVIVINKAPAVNVPEKKTRVRGNIALVIDEVFTDPDNNLDLTTIAATSKNNARVTIGTEIITVDYDNLTTFEGFDEVTVTICDQGARCITEVIPVEVGADPVIYNGMSPNGDGVNDWFHVEFAPLGTEVSIYNRWGEAIFETDNYDVTDPAKRFEGKTKNGTDVVAGSYYYKIRYPDKTIKTGNILLNR